MKERVKYLTINQFAKMFGITKHTLYHYEAVGVFGPMKITEKGYRYYSYTQYDRFRFILLLREMDVPLAEIKAYLDDEGDLEKLLDENIEKLNQKIDQLEANRRYMEGLLQYAKSCEGIVVDQIQIETLPERIVYGSSVKIKKEKVNYAQSMEAYAKFCYDHQVEVKWMSGSRIALSAIKAGDVYAYDFVFSDHPWTAETEPEKKTLEAGQWLSIYYRGRYENCYLAYLKLMDYAKEQGLMLEDYGYEFYVTNHIITQNDEAQVVKVMIKVK